MAKVAPTLVGDLAAWSWFGVPAADEKGVVCFDGIRGGGVCVAVEDCGGDGVVCAWVRFGSSWLGMVGLCFSWAILTSYGVRPWKALLLVGMSLGDVLLLWRPELDNEQRPFSAWGRLVEDNAWR